jgi:hypothetical protein
MSTQSIAFRFLPSIGDFTLNIFVASDEPYASDDWALYMEELRKALHLPMRTLVLTEGGSPDAAQRRAMIDLFNGVAPPLTCVVSQSPMVRGMTTALSWFNPNLKSVSPAQMKEALAYLGIPATYEERVVVEIRHLRAQLPRLRVLARRRQR